MFWSSDAWYFLIENFSFFGQKLIFDQIKTKFNQHEDKVDSQFKLNSIVETKFNLKFKFQIWHSYSY